MAARNPRCPTLQSELDVMSVQYVRQQRMLVKIGRRADFEFRDGPSKEGDAGCAGEARGVPDSVDAGVLVI